MIKVGGIVVKVGSAVIDAVGVVGTGRVNVGVDFRETVGCAVTAGDEISGGRDAQPMSKKVVYRISAASLPQRKLLFVLKG
jgi:hypothetical protein